MRSGKLQIGVVLSLLLAVLVAERLTDSIAMMGLAPSGLLLYHFGWGVLLIILLASVGDITVVQNRPLTLWLLQHAEKLPLLLRLASMIRTFYESTYARKEDRCTEGRKEAQATRLTIDKRLSGSVPASAPAHVGEQML